METEVPQTQSRWAAMPRSMPMPARTRHSLATAHGLVSCCESCERSFHEFALRERKCEVLGDGCWAKQRCLAFDDFETTPMVDQAALGNGQKPVAGHDISSPGLKLFHSGNKDQRREVLCKGGISCHSDAEKPEDHG